MKGIDPWLEWKEERKGGERIEKRKYGPFVVERSGRQSERKEKQTREEQTAVCEVGRTFLREYCLDLNENSQESSKQPIFLVGRT